MRRPADEVTIASRRGSFLLGVLSGAAKPFAYPERVAGLVGIRPGAGQVPRLKAGSVAPPPAFPYPFAPEDNGGLPGLDDPDAHGRDLPEGTGARVGRAGPASGRPSTRSDPPAAPECEAELPGTTECPSSPLPEPYAWSADDRGEAPSDASELPDGGAHEETGPSPPPGGPVASSPASAPSSSPEPAVERVPLPSRERSSPHEEAEGEPAEPARPRSVAPDAMPPSAQDTKPASPASRRSGTRMVSDERGVPEAGHTIRRGDPVGREKDPPSMAVTAAQAIPASRSVPPTASQRLTVSGSQPLGAFPHRRPAAPPESGAGPAASGKPAEASGRRRGEAAGAPTAFPALPPSDDGARQGAASESTRHPAREAPRQTVHQDVTVLSAPAPTPPGGRGYWQRRYLGRAFSRRGR